MFLFTAKVNGQHDTVLINRFVSPGIDAARQLLQKEELDSASAIIDQWKDTIINDSPEPIFLQGMLMKRFADDLSDIEMYSLSNQYFDSAIVFLKSSQRFNIMAECYLGKGVNHFYFKDIDAAMEALDTVKELYAVHGDPLLSAYSQTFNLRGNFYANTGNDYLAFTYFEKSLQFDFDPGDRAYAYNNMGVTLTNLGDHERGIDYIQKALDIALAKQIDKNELIEIYLSLHSAQLEIELFFDASQSFRKALYLVNSANSENDEIKLYAWNELANLLIKQQKMDSAFSLLKKAEQIRSDHPQTLHNLAAYFYEVENYDQAIRYLQKVMQIDRVGEKSYYSSSLLGQIYEKQDRIEAALAQYQQVLILVSQDFQQTNYRTNPTWDNIQQRFMFFTAINKKIHALRKLPANQENIQLTLETSKLATRLIDSLNHEYQNEKTRERFQKEVRSLYEMAISTALDFYEITGEREALNLAFTWTEKSKSALLTAHLRQSEALLYAGVDSTLQQKLFQVNRWRTFYTNQIIIEKQKKEKPDSLKLKDWENLEFDFNQQYDSLKKVLKKQYPKYYQLTYNYGVTSIDDIQRTIHEGKALLEYFSGEKEWVLFAITQDTMMVFRELKHSLDAEILAILPYLKDYGSDINGFYNKSRRLYQKIVLPVQPLIEQYDLIIIPDGLINKIPFEVLLSKDVEANAWSSLPYLMIDHSIAYGYSSTLWQKSGNWRTERRLQRNVREGKKFLGYAPNSGLQYTEEEVEQISSLIKGKIRRGEEANKENFLDEAREYGIIHLATHAYINDNLPLKSRLSFTNLELNEGIDSTKEVTYPGDLYAWELYSRSFKAQMVVLSACESGTGYLQRAEGVMSLGRAFAYAGVPSIVASLWKAVDESTSEIMVFFYQNLLAGMTKDQALRTAKRDYLTSNSSKAHPYYWAPFVVMGDAGALHESSIFSQEFWWVFAIFVILGLGLILKALQLRASRGKLN